MAKGFGKGVGGAILKPQAGRYIADTNESLITDTRQKVYGDSSDIRWMESSEALKNHTELIDKIILSSREFARGMQTVLRPQTRRRWEYLLNGELFSSKANGPDSEALCHLHKMLHESYEWWHSRHQKKYVRTCFSGQLEGLPFLFQCSPSLFFAHWADPIRIWEGMSSLSKGTSIKCTTLVPPVPILLCNAFQCRPLDPLNYVPPSVEQGVEAIIF